MAIFKRFPIFIIIQILSIISNRELIFVYEHVRHGARGPSSGFQSYFEDGKDEYNVYWNTDGELSPIGKRQHYILGLRNKLKYYDFMDGFKTYDPKAILIHATNYNRTHQSINMELKAMYEDAIEPKLTEAERDFKMINRKYIDENFNATLTRLIDRVEDDDKKTTYLSPIYNIRSFGPNRIFLVDHCTKLKQYRDETVGREVEAFYEEFRRDYSFHFQQFFPHPEYFTDYDKMKSITDHYICDYDNQKDLEHIRKHFDLEEFYAFSRRFYGHFIFNYFVDGYTAGLEETHLMQDLIGYMESRIKYHPKITYYAPKMVMDCGHDTTVGPMARFMDSAFNCGYHKFCDFACNIYIELYKEDDGTYTVDYYLDDERMFEKINFQEFKKKVESRYWNDTFSAQFCGTEEDTHVNQTNWAEENVNFLIGGTIVSTSFFLIFITSTFVLYRRIKKWEKKYGKISYVNPGNDEDKEPSDVPD